MPKITRALVSVSDKEGVVSFCRGLTGLGISILSTGGTAGLLGESGVTVGSVAGYTSSPEILGGRVKTLHPFIHGGILARRENPSDMRQLREMNVGLIDMVVVNFYPFERVTGEGADLDEAVENIDIGGPTMVRSAAKNFRDVLVIVDPSDYDRVISALGNGGGEIPFDFRLELALKAFTRVTAYNDAIARFLGRVLKCRRGE